MQFKWITTTIVGMLAVSQPLSTAYAQTLTVGAAAEATSLDPQFQNLSSNAQMQAMIFETLLGRDASAKVYPLLAASYELIDDTTWEFKLREGVTWHNGDTFTAEDVRFSIERVPTIEASPGPYDSYVAGIEEVEVIDDYTVRLHTAQPIPTLLLDLSVIFILNHRITDGATNDDFTSGSVAVGTGPYKFESYSPRQELIVTRNDDYWGELGDFENIEYRMITNSAARSAALLSGDVDYIDQVPPSNIATIEQDSSLYINRFPALRSMFLVLDQTGDGPFVFDNDGAELPASVLQDTRVREALSIAIDRGAIVDRVMEGAAFPSGQIMPEGASGYVADISAPAYNPERAKELLAEAGYPDGFRLTLHGPGGHYPNDAAIIQAVAQYWSRIDIETEVVVQPFAGFLGRAANQEFSAWLASWGSSLGEAGSTLNSLVRSFNPELNTGAANRHRFSDPELDALIDSMMTEMNPDRRLELMEDSVRMAMEKEAIIPILLLQNVTAMRDHLEAQGRADARIYAHDVRLKD